MFCRNCGKELHVDAKFCEYYGEPVSVSVASDRENEKKIESDNLSGAQSQQNDSLKNERVSFNSNVNYTTQPEVHNNGFRIGYLYLASFFL